MISEFRYCLKHLSSLGEHDFGIEVNGNILKSQT